jgi:hypothetical protein
LTLASSRERVEENANLAGREPRRGGDTLARASCVGAARV